MAESIALVALAEMLKKLIGIFSDQLAKRLFDQADPRRAVLTDLHKELQSLELALIHLIDIFDALKSPTADIHDLDHSLAVTLRDARRSLDLIQRQVQLLEPGLSIMAENVVPDVLEFYGHEMLMVDQLGLLRGGWYTRAESPASYKRRLSELRKEAVTARERVAAFVRQAYTWRDFQADLDRARLKRYKADRDRK